MQIARGKLNGVNTGVGLTAVHCTELSKHAVTTGFYYIAVEWAEMAFKLVKNGDHSIDVQSVKEAIATAVSAVSFFLSFLNLGKYRNECNTYVNIYNFVISFSTTRDTRSQRAGSHIFIMTGSKL